MRARASTRFCLFSSRPQRESHRRAPKRARAHRLPPPPFFQQQLSARTAGGGDDAAAATAAAVAAATAALEKTHAVAVAGRDALLTHLKDAAAKASAATRAAAAERDAALQRAATLEAWLVRWREREGAGRGVRRARGDSESDARCLFQSPAPPQGFVSLR